MAASTLNLDLEQGATYRRQLIWKVSADGDPVDLTGYTARMQIRRHAASADALVTLDQDNEGLVLGGAEGTIDLALSAEQTTALPPGGSVYDLFLTDPDGYATRFLEGTVTVARAVTRG